MLTILTIRWCRRSVGESCELWEVLSEDVWQGKVRGYRLSATCVHFDARAKTAHSRSIQRQRRPGTSVAKSFAVRFAAGARLSVSVAFVGFRALFTLLYNLFYLPCKLHDLNRAFATLCAGSRRGAGAASDYRRLASEPSGSGAAPPYIAHRMATHLSPHRLTREYESECKKIETTGLTNLRQQ